MFASIDEAVEYWKDELSYVDDAKVTGYVGGYPVVEFTINKAAWGLVKDKKKFGRIVRSSEMEGGIEVGVSTCFYQTAQNARITVVSGSKITVNIGPIVCAKKNSSVSI